MSFELPYSHFIYSVHINHYSSLELLDSSLPTCLSVILLKSTASKTRPEMKGKTHFSVDCFLAYSESELGSGSPPPIGLEGALFGNFLAIVMTARLLRSNTRKKCIDFHK